MQREVRIHNFQRAQKREKEKEATQYIVTPPKYQYKNRIWIMKSKL